MKVLLVDLARHFGGVDIRVRQTAMHLSDRHEIATVVIDGSPVHKALKAEGLRCFPLRRARWNPLVARDIVRVARDFGADLIDTHNPQSQLWGLLAATRLPGVGRVATVHTVYREAHRGPVRQISHEAVLRLARRLGAEFITVSQSISRYLHRLGVVPERETLSYNALEPVARDLPPAGLRDQLGLDPGTPVCAMIGRLERVKGHDLMFEALRHLEARGHTPHLAVIGTGSLEATLRAEATAAGLGSRVHFLGFRTDVPSLLEEVDLLCMPSRSEGLPYTALEAGRQGVPLLATTVDGLAEVFRDGETARLVPPESAEGFAEVMAEMLASPEARARLGAAVRAMIETRFAIPRMVDETLAVYERARRSQEQP